LCCALRPFPIDPRSEIHQSLFKRTHAGTAKEKAGFITHFTCPFNQQARIVAVYVYRAEHHIVLVHDALYRFFTAFTVPTVVTEGAAKRFYHLFLWRHYGVGKVEFVLQEGLDDIVLDTDLIPSEAEEHVKPILSKLKKTYGSPLVIVRDMAKGLALCASNIFPNRPQQICQVHFIRNLEKDLVTGYHKRLKHAMVKHRLTRRLRALRNAESGDNGMKMLQQRWVHIAVDYLLYLGYSLSPFVNDLPKLRKEYRETRKGPEIQIADEKRMGILEDFIHALETTGSSNELVYTLQSILGLEADMGAVCLC